MSTLKKFLMAIPVVGAIATLNISSPVLAANQIIVKVGSLERTISISALEDFVKTGDTSGLPIEFSSPFFTKNVEQLKKQLQRQISIDPDSELNSKEQDFMDGLMPTGTEEERKAALTLMKEKGNGQITLDFLKVLPGDILSSDNFMDSLNAYQAIPIKTPDPEPTPIDLRTWKKEGASASGNWVVSPDGTFVRQTINGLPTFFVTPDNFINTTVNGKFKVEDTIDNDFIGFVFGYQSPIAANGDAANNFNFLLFDWKKSGYDGGVPDLAHEGFGLTKVNGTFPTNNDVFASFVQHREISKFDLLATDYGIGKGWKPYQEYDFTLLYQTDRIKIDIDGKTIFDIAGEFEPGRFGFYNFSQSNVRYSGFTQEETPPAKPVPEPSSMLGLLAFGTFGIASLLKRKQQQKVVNSVVNN